MKNEKNIRKRIISQIKGFRGYVVFSFIISIIIQILALLPPLFMEKIIDEYIPDKDIRQVGLGIFIFTGVPIISSLLSTGYNYIINVVGRQSGQKLTVWAFEKLIYQPLNYFDEANSSELASYCKGESNKYVMLWLYDIPSATASIISGLAVCILMFKFSVLIALVVILAIPFAILPSMLIAKQLEKNVKKMVESNAKISQVMEDTFRGIKLVKSMSLEKDRIRLISFINKAIVKIWSKIAALDNLNGTWVSGFSSNLFTGAIFLLSVYLIIRNQLSVGMLVVILSYLPKIFTIVSNTTSINFSFKKQLAEFDKLFSIINMNDERDNTKSNKQFTFNKSIEFQNVTFAYKKDRGNVLKNLSFSVKKNQWAGIVGKSGAGKSTIFDLLLRFYDCTEGCISIDDTNVQLINIDELRQNIVLVSQNTFLFPGTIKDNLLIANKYATNEELARVIDEVGLKKFLDSLPDNINTEIGENGIQLSGGEKQRISLAQGLLRHSKILLLDEVTSNVDASTEIEIKETIEKIRKSKDLTVVSISHKLDFLDSTDNIFLIEDGRLAECGTFEYASKWTDKLRKH